jgi:DNA polymerase elongation subunit (family B)
MSPDKKNVLVWERNKKGERILKRHSPEYYFYYQNDEYGDKKDLYGNNVSKLEFNSYSQMRDARNMLIEKGKDIYESDIPLEYKTLSNKYFNKKSTNKLNFTLYDIETDYDPKIGYAKPKNAYAPVNAIAMYHEYSQRMVILAIPSKKFKNITIDDIPEDIKESVEIYLFKKESDLLLRFLKEIENSDIISGWNSDFYDTPYMYERLLKVLGKKYANKLSFEGAGNPYYKEVKHEKFKNVQKLLVLKGRINIDYMLLYKNFEMDEKPSYTLEAISEYVLPDLQKLTYNGTLHELYNNDFFHFLRYNKRDTEVLKGFEDVLGYMQVAIDMAHMTGGQINDVLGTIKLAEQAVINYSHETTTNVIKDKPVFNDIYEKFTGALVLPPQIGMHSGISAIDIGSLYPNVIISLNISPETIVGQFIEKEKAYENIKNKTKTILTFFYENGDVDERTAEEWSDFFKQNKYTLSGYGTVFRTDIIGIIPSILTEWYKSRKEYQAKKTVTKDKIKELSKTPEMEKINNDKIKKLKIEANYYHRVQYIKKIQLNSMYGALGNKWFKFFDIRLAESTTRSGREILMHMVRKVANILDGEYIYPSDSTIYSDTDSCYFKTHCEDMEKAYSVGKYVEKKVNKSFPSFMEETFFCYSDFSKKIFAEQEILADKGIFVKKKHYILHLIKKDGYDVDEMKIMGLPLKRTTVPKMIKENLIRLMRDLLTGRSWKDISYELVEYRYTIKEKTTLIDIGLPKGVNKVEEYTEKYENGEELNKIPGHVRASILYNYCLEKYNDLESYSIMSGSKIKVYYLKKPIGIFKSIAVPTDMNEFPTWFMEHFYILIDKEAQTQRLIENTVKSILGAIGEIMPTFKTLLFDELVEY